MTAQATAGGGTLNVPAGQPVVVISPHLDAAVFSCGELPAARPGSLMVTAMAGVTGVGSGLCAATARPPAARLRQGWAEAFKEMAERGDDVLLDAHTATTTFDLTDWEWMATF